jgi:hypothetical protein
MKSLINDELVINTIVTLNNLSFYDSDLFVNRSLDLINSKFKFLKIYHKNKEILF